MKNGKIIWSGHVLALVLFALGLWWLSGDMARMPDYRLWIALVAITGLVLNHFRWWALSGDIEDKDISAKLNRLIISNYLIFLLVFALVDFRH
jgi:hypothetical protein